MSGRSFQAGEGLVGAFSVIVKSLQTFVWSSNININIYSIYTVFVVWTPCTSCCTPSWSTGGPTWCSARRSSAPSASRGIWYDHDQYHYWTGSDDQVFILTVMMIRVPPIWHWYIQLLSMTRSAWWWPGWWSRPPPPPSCAAPAPPSSGQGLLHWKPRGCEALSLVSFTIKDKMKS